MTQDVTVLHDYRPQNNTSIRIANDFLPTILGTGPVQSTTDVWVSSIMHNKNFNCNIISISKLSRDLNCVPKFFPNLCEFQGMGLGRTIGNTELMLGLYILKITIPSSRQAANQSSKVSLSPSKSLSKFHSYHLFSIQVSIV